MKIPRNLHDKMILHARKELPHEACGYLAGQDDTVMETYPIKNIDQSHEHFSFAPEEQFTAVKDMRQKKIVPLAVYHSHPKTPARPSKEDIRLAYDPDIYHVIISLARDTPDIKAFKIDKNKTGKTRVRKEEIEIL